MYRQIKIWLLGLCVLSFSVQANLDTSKFFEAEVVIIKQSKEGAYLGFPFAREVVNHINNKAYVIYLPVVQDSHGSYMEGLLQGVYSELGKIKPKHIIVSGKHLMKAYLKSVPPSLLDKTAFTALMPLATNSIVEDVGIEIKNLMNDLQYKVDKYYILVGVSSSGKSIADELASRLGKKSVIIQVSSEFELQSTVSVLQGKPRGVIINSVNLLLDLETGSYLGLDTTTELIKRGNRRHLDIALYKTRERLSIVVSINYDELLTKLLNPNSKPVAFEIDLLINPERFRKLGHKSKYLDNFKLIDGIIHDSKAD